MGESSGSSRMIVRDWDSRREPGLIVICKALRGKSKSGHNRSRQGLEPLQYDFVLRGLKAVDIIGLNKAEGR